MEGVREPLVVRELPDPECPAHGAVIRVEANGACRSDWHGWVGDWDWIGTQGMPAARYDAMLAMISAGKLSPGDLVTSTLSLEEVGGVLAAMDDFATIGIPVIDTY